MKRATSGIGAMAVGIALLTLPGAYAWAQQQRPGFEMYVVRKGDTLAGISGRVFGDVKRWREILKDNPQVTNANRIYPGDTLLVPAQTAAGGSGVSTGELVAGAGTARSLPAAGMPENALGGAATGEQGPGGDPGATEGSDATVNAAATTPAVDPLRADSVINPKLYRSAGSIEESLPPIAIIATQDDRMIIGSGDVAVINAPHPPGTRFTVVRADRRIFHPVTHQALGWLVRVLGTGEVTCRGERTSTMVLRSMNDTSSVGDYLVPFDEKDVFEPAAPQPATVRPGCLPPGTLDGVIVAFNDVRLAVGSLDLVYIDRGSASGVTPGQRFTIYREVAPERHVIVGELQVLRAGLNTSTALITAAAEEVQIGYLLRSR